MDKVQEATGEERDPGVPVPLGAGWEGSEQAGSHQSFPRPSAVPVMGPSRVSMGPNRVSVSQASAQADSFQQMVAGVYEATGIHTGTPGAPPCCSSRQGQCPWRKVAEQAVPGAKVPWGATALPWCLGHGHHELSEGLAIAAVNSDMKWQGDALVDSAANWGGSPKMAVMAQAKMAAMAQAKVVAMALSKMAAMAQAKTAATAVGQN